MNAKSLFTIIAVLFLVWIVFPVGFVLASSERGLVSGYAWSEKIGWINFGDANGGVIITDSSLSGYAWNENEGRINLSPSNGGVKNDGNGNLSGKAWCEGTGWIDFSGVNVSSSGVFSGIAHGDNNLSINFSCAHCAVSTDWLPSNLRQSSSSQQINSAMAGQARANIIINNNSFYTNNIEVDLTLAGGTNAKKMIISNSSDFSNSVEENYANKKVWKLDAGDGQKNVYAKFYNQYEEVSDVVFSSIILDTKIPEIKIESIKNNYLSTEDVIVSGSSSKPSLNITMVIDSNYGQFSADNNGNWSINLGKQTVGIHHLEFYAVDVAGNKSEIIAQDFTVGNVGVVSQTSGVPFILKNIQQGIESFLPKILKPINTLPKPVVIIPKSAPVSMSGKFKFLPSFALSKFVLSPLPEDVALIAQKFPQVEKTFNEVNVAKITDLTKLKNANLKLPTFSESLGLAPVNISGQKFAMPSGIRVESLTATAKSKIPSAIVFSKAAGGLVDLKTALSLNDQGQTQQTIETIVKQPLQLVVRVDRPVKKVIGYFVFKSKNTSGQLSSNISLNNLTASLLFAYPNLASAISPAKNIENSDNVEKRLVLSEFEYTNSGNGVYTATVQAPVVAGNYEMITQMQYLDPQEKTKEIKMITVVDPEGYIYEKNGSMETRIVGGVVSLYWLNQKTNQYELWPAKDYQQENPQTTDLSGNYSFLVPNGDYYLKVEAPGYLSYEGKPFQVKEGSGVHINIEMKTHFWWLKVADWQTVLLTVVILLLIYNFYRDKIREKSNNKN
jgi:hypothetical protein